MSGTGPVLSGNPGYMGPSSAGGMGSNPFGYLGGGNAGGMGMAGGSMLGGMNGNNPQLMSLLSLLSSQGGGAGNPMQYAGNAGGMGQPVSNMGGFNPVSTTAGNTSFNGGNNGTYSPSQLGWGGGGLLGGNAGSMGSPGSTPNNPAPAPIPQPQNPQLPPDNPGSFRGGMRSPIQNQVELRNRF